MVLLICKSPMNHLHSIASSEPGQDREVAALSFLVMWVEMVDRRFSIQKRKTVRFSYFFSFFNYLVCTKKSYVE